MNVLLGSLKSYWFNFGFSELFCLYLLEVEHWKNIAEMLNLVDILPHFLIAFDMVDRTCFLNLFFPLVLETPHFWFFPGLFWSPTVQNLL